MAGESVSFRITRTTEDLAQTVAALSQRLVKLEQRLEALSMQLDQTKAPAEPDPEELQRLDQVAVLLADCRHLLEDSGRADGSPSTTLAWAEADHQEPLAA
ncbi:MAG: hypothetical protein RLZZ124_297 [Cyanobacteriota bacterium]|jgi:uncharacterized membrane protein YccC